MPFLDIIAPYFAFLTTAEGWAALVTLIAMEVVLGIDNLIFISILTNKLPPEHRVRARRLGISAALIMRLVLLATISFIVADDRSRCSPRSARASRGATSS